MMGWQLAAIWLVDRYSNTLKCKAILACALRQCRGIHGGVPDDELHGRRRVTRQSVEYRGGRMDLRCAHRSELSAAQVASEAGLRGALGFIIRGRENIHGVVGNFQSRSPRAENELLQMMMDIGI
jgi:hypothetical protein